MTSDSDASDTLPLILFSGLAADANVFIPQKLAFPQLFVPEWPKPLKGESMSAYCERIADELRSHGPCVIGGASFGGVIAQEVSEHLSAAAVILIGSIRSPTELPLYARLARPLRFLVPLIPVRLLQLLVAPAASPLAQKIAPHWGGMARQFRNSSPQVFKWSLRRILDWRKRAEPNCPFSIFTDFVDTSQGGQRIHSRCARSNRSWAIQYDLDRVFSQPTGRTHHHDRPGRFRVDSRF